MPNQIIKQYFEFLKLSGLQHLFFSAEKFDVKAEKHECRMDKSKEEILAALAKQYNDCDRCDLAQTRKNVVYGNGCADAKMMVIGEGPGQEEDISGKPFVGRAGQLLTKMLNAIDIEREEVYITNVVKCRPPNNRNPQILEIKSCLPYLEEQIEVIDPKLILLLGRVACDALIGGADTLKRYRQNKLEYLGIPVFATYHPSALLRTPKWKREAWEDLKVVKNVYDNIEE
jgi:DNA polymerase